jgi:hypothetical protein
MTAERLDITSLADGPFRQYARGEIVDHDEITCTVEWDAGSAVLASDIDDGTLWTASPATITLTFPITVDVGPSSGATLAGTGFITGFSTPELSADGYATAQVTFSFDGTDIAFTAQV